MGPDVEWSVLGRNSRTLLVGFHNCASVAASKSFSIRSQKPGVITVAPNFLKALEARPELSPPFS
jgi:hypothetical protein